MRTGYTVPTDAEYSLLRKAMALYAEYDYKNDDETINKIALAIGRKPNTARKMIAGGMRNTDSTPTRTAKKAQRM